MGKRSAEQTRVDRVAKVEKLTSDGTLPGRERGRAAGRATPTRPVGQDSVLIAAPSGRVRAFDGIGR